MQAENRGFETMTLKKAFREALFQKNFACFAGKKHTLLHETVLGGVLFFKSVIYYLHSLIYLYLFIIYYYY